MAELGLQNRAIAEACGLGISTLSRNRRIKQSIQRGRDTARRKVMETLSTMAEADAPTTFRLAKELGCFTRGIDCKKPQSPKDALELLAETIQRYAKGELDANQAKTIEALVGRYVATNEKVELEARLSRIEEMLDRLEQEK